jgi:hypothetical protein
MSIMGNSRGSQRPRRALAVIGVAAAVVLSGGLTSCKVHVDQGPNGEDKKVQVETPFGGVHVSTDQTNAADLGLPVYPGATVTNDDQKDKSADVHMGFGDFELRVQVVNYSTPDSQDKVTAFYKKALQRYGDVIACQDHQPVGAPTTTSEGLTCAEHGHQPQMKFNGREIRNNQGGFELKAGSERRQHIVAFQSARAGETRFTLVALELPRVENGKSD